MWLCAVFPFFFFSIRSQVRVLNDWVLIPEIGETEGQVKNSLVRIFSLFNLVSKYLWLLLLIFPIKCNASCNDNGSSLHKRKRRQHDDPTKIIIYYLKIIHSSPLTQRQSRSPPPHFAFAATISCFFFSALVGPDVRLNQFHFCNSVFDNYVGR